MGGAGKGRLDRWLQRTKESRAPATEAAPRAMEQGGGGGGGGGAAAAAAAPSNGGGGKLGKWLAKTKNAAPPNELSSTESSSSSSTAPQAAGQAAAAAAAASTTGASPAAPGAIGGAEGGGRGSSKLDRWRSRSAAAAAAAAAPPAPAPAGATSKLDRWRSKTSGPPSSAAAVTEVPITSTGTSAQAKAEAEVEEDRKKGEAERMADLDEFVQDAKNGYHRIDMPDKARYVGWVKNMVPDGVGSRRDADRSEYHGEFEAGLEHGGGKWIFSDGSNFAGLFQGGCPKSGHYTEEDGKTRWKVEYSGTQSFRDGRVEPVSKVEDPRDNYTEARADCVGLTLGKPRQISEKQWAGQYPHIRDIYARLVLARPPYADEPLWNAEQVRGCIVAIMRGPRSPGPVVSYGMKCYYAQQAGAAAVVFVDWDPNGAFTFIPRIDAGEIYEGGPKLDCQIPCCFVLNKNMSRLQEGAMHQLAFAPDNNPIAPFGWKIGYIMCPRQESGVGLSKEKADSLMLEFLAERKKERTEESADLAKKLESGSEDTGTKGKEYIQGSLFHSLNPFGTAEGVPNVDPAALAADRASKVAQHWMNQSSEMAARMMAAAPSISFPSPSFPSPFSSSPAPADAAGSAPDETKAKKQEEAQPPPPVEKAASDGEVANPPPAAVNGSKLDRWRQRTKNGNAGAAAPAVANGVPPTRPVANGVAPAAANGVPPAGSAAGGQKEEKKEEKKEGGGPPAPPLPKLPLPPMVRMIDGDVAFAQGPGEGYLRLNRRDIVALHRGVLPTNKGLPPTGPVLDASGAGGNPGIASGGGVGGVPKVATAAAAATGTGTGTGTGGGGKLGRWRARTGAAAKPGGGEGASEARKGATVQGGGATSPGAGGGSKLDRWRSRVKLAKWEKAALGAEGGASSQKGGGGGEGDGAGGGGGGEGEKVGKRDAGDETEEVTASAAMASGGAEEREEEGVDPEVASNPAKAMIEYSGMMRGGSFEGFGSCRFADSSEYHGDWVRGKMHGKGYHVFPDGTRFQGFFNDGCPEGEGILFEPFGERFQVSYAGGVPFSEDPDPVQKVEVQQEAFMPIKAESVSFTKSPQVGRMPDGTPLPNTYPNDFSHIRDVTGRLVWARPPLADVPLWNAHEVRGKIAVVVRGPRFPAPAVNYHEKIHHVQEAGAAAVVVVDWDPKGRFSTLPRIEEGVSMPDGKKFVCKIPTAFTLFRFMDVLQEGALVTLMFAPVSGTMGFNMGPPGWKIGSIILQPQVNEVGLSKDKANALMQEFLQARKNERAQEGTMLKENKEKGTREGDNNSQEFLSGSLLYSLNPLRKREEVIGHGKKVGENLNLEGKVAAAMTNKARYYALMYASPEYRQWLLKKEAEARLIASEVVNEVRQADSSKGASVLGELVKGAFSTMTGDALNAEILRTSTTAWSATPSLFATPAWGTPSRQAEGDAKDNLPPPRSLFSPAPAPATATTPQVSSQGGQPQTSTPATSTSWLTPSSIGVSMSLPTMSMPTVASLFGTSSSASTPSNGASGNGDGESNGGDAAAAAPPAEGTPSKAKTGYYPWL